MDTNIDLFGDNVKNSNISPVKIFNNSKFGTLRVFVIDGEIWFIGNDVSTMLGYEVPKKAVYDHVKDRDKRLIKLSDIQDGTEIVPSHMKGSKITIINESGLYSLTLSSKLPSAEDFKDWVTHEVLPSIRKYGYYRVDNKPAITKEEYELRMMEAKAMMRDAEARIMESKRKSAELMLSLKDKTSIPEVAAIAESYAVNIMAGKDLVALPEVNERTLTATEVGRILGISAHKVGMISNKHGLKTPEFGKWFYDKSRHSDKEVESFRYYEKAVEEIRKFLR